MEKNTTTNLACHLLAMTLKRSKLLREPECPDSCKSPVLSTPYCKWPLDVLVCLGMLKKSVLFDCLLLQRPRVEVPSACTVAAERTGMDRNCVPCLRASASLTRNTSRHHSIDNTDWMLNLHAWLEHFSHLYHPGSKWLQRISVCNDVDCAYVELCDVAKIMWIWNLFNIFRLLLLNKSVVMWWLPVGNEWLKFYV